MTRYDKVSSALLAKTLDTNNCITLTKNVLAAGKGKYATRNIVTNNISQITYKTLDEVIKEFNLTIK